MTSSLLCGTAHAGATSCVHSLGVPTRVLPKVIGSGKPESRSPPLPPNEIYTEEKDWCAKQRRTRPHQPSHL
eukprot:3804741-Amphidinium_carterae.1